ncbi:MAG: hypothetical protein Q9213_005551 [Squamulea squamosa]
MCERCSPGGIGNALAREFHSRGLRVLATAGTTEDIQDLTEAGIEILSLDVTSDKSINACKKEVVARTDGKLDFLVNNAGRNYTVPAIEAEPSEIESLFATNLFGVMRLCQTFMPLLRHSKGTIVQIGSVAGVIPYAWGAVYNASKAALHSYSATLRIEVAALGVHVITVITGGVRSRIARDKRSLGDESAYKKIEGGYQKRQAHSQTVGMDTQAYAKEVVGKVLAAEGWLWRTRTIWAGGMAETDSKAMGKDIGPSGRCREEESNPSLLGLPPEILNAIVKKLSPHDKAHMAATCKLVKIYIEPQVWRKIKTCIGTPHDTAGLVALLTDRTDIVPMIKELVLDEYHPCHTRRLLSIKMPNVSCILVQHEGQPVEHVSERDKRALNRGLVDQPKLNKLVFWIELTSDELVPYKLSREDAALFRQTALENLRLSFVDFSNFEFMDKTYFTHTKLSIVWLEDSQYSPDALYRLISPSEKLTKLTIHHWGDPPFVPSHYLPTLTHAAKTLMILRLQWRHTRLSCTPGYEGLDLTGFPALRLLRIQPSVLLGPGGKGVKSYTTSSQPDITGLVRSRLPSGLRIILLESLTIPAPVEGLKMRLFPDDKEFIKCLIEHKQNLAPRLTHIFMYYLEEMSEPTELYDLADKHGMEICGLFSTDVINPDCEALDSDTYVIRNGDKKDL